MAESADGIVYPPGVRDLSEDISTDDLVRRLKECAQAFQSMAQEEENASQYEPLAHFLVSERFLEHKSSDVRLLVACCAADIFRVSAPDAPYRDEYQIKMLLEFFIDQLQGLSDQKHPAFRRYFYLLENLSVVKTFNICFDLQDSQKIMCSLFKQMFKIIKDNQIPRLPRIISDLLCPLINEADLVPAELINIILNHIIEPKKSENKNACMLAQDILQKTSSSLGNYIQGYFTNEFYMGEQNVSESLCDLIYELCTINQSMMSFIIPQLEGKLKSSDEDERVMITGLVARMFSTRNSNMIYENRSLWQSYLSRSFDVSPKVRLLCVQCAKNFLLYHPESKKEISELLTQRSRDMEESIRHEVIAIICSIALEDIFCIDNTEMDILKDRSLDKTFRIRKAVLFGLGRLYKKYILEAEYVDPVAEKLLCFVKNKVLHVYYQSSLDDKFLVERILLTCFVPFQNPTEQRMKYLYQFYCTIDNHAKRVFKEILRNQKYMRSLTIGVLDIIQNDRPNKTKLLESKINVLARLLPGLRRSAENVSKFCKDLENNLRLRGMISLLLSDGMSCVEAEKKVSEFMQFFCSKGLSTTGNIYYFAIKQLLERIVPLLLDKESVKYLVSIAKDSIIGDKAIEAEMKLENSGQRGLDLLKVLADTYPYYFDDEEIFRSFVQILRADDPEIAKVTLKILSVIGKGLEKNYPLVYSELLPILETFMESGTPKQAKYATTTLDKMVTNKENIFGQIIQNLEKHFSLESDYYRIALVSISHIANLCPSMFAIQFKTSVAKIVVKGLLMKDCTEARHGGDLWGPLESLPYETKVKIEGMKLMVRWLTGLKDVIQPAISTFRLFNLIILHDGDLMQKKFLANKESSWMRLSSARCILKLCWEPNYAQYLDVNFFVKLAYVMNDRCPQVREIFAAKVNKGLFLMKLPLEFLAILALGGLDPRKEFRSTIKRYLFQNICKRKEYVKDNSISEDELPCQWPDYSLPIVVYLFAHAPFFTTYDHIPSLLKIKDCLHLFIEALIWKKESYSFAFFKRLLENVKQTKDKLYPNMEDMNLKLYAVSDLALNILMSEKNIIWKDFPGQPKLNSKFFTEPDKNYSNLVTYLPPELLNTNRLVESGFQIEVFDKTKDKNTSNNVAGASTSKGNADPTSKSSVPQSTEKSENDIATFEIELSETVDQCEAISKMNSAKEGASENESLTETGSSSESGAKLTNGDINHSETQSDTELDKVTSKKGNVKSKNKSVLKEKPQPKRSVANHKGSSQSIKNGAPLMQNSVLPSSPSATSGDTLYTSDYGHLIQPCSVCVERLEHSDVFKINENGSYSFKRKHEYMDSEDFSSSQKSSTGSHPNEETPRKRGRPPKQPSNKKREKMNDEVNEPKNVQTVKDKRANGQQNKKIDEKTSVRRR